MALHPLDLPFGSELPSLRVADRVRGVKGIDYSRLPPTGNEPQPPGVRSSLPSAEARSWLLAAHWTGWARVCSTLPGSPGNQAQLEDPTSSEGQDNDRPQNHGEEQCYAERQATMEGQEVQLYALRILKDEDEDHQQGHDSDDERSPGSAEPRLPLARIRSARRGLWRRAIHDFGCNAYRRVSQARTRQGQAYVEGLSRAARLARAGADLLAGWRFPGWSSEETICQRHRLGLGGDPIHEDQPLLSPSCHVSRDQAPGPMRRTSQPLPVV